MAKEKLPSNRPAAQSVVRKTSAQRYRLEQTGRSGAHLEDTPAVRGMIDKVTHLVRVIES